MLHRRRAHQTERVETVGEMIERWAEEIAREQKARQEPTDPRLLGWGSPVIARERASRVEWIGGE